MKFNLLLALVPSFYQPGLWDSLGVLTCLRILGGRPCSFFCSCHLKVATFLIRMCLGSSLSLGGAIFATDPSQMEVHFSRIAIDLPGFSLLPGVLAQQAPPSHLRATPPPAWCWSPGPRRMNVVPEQASAQWPNLVPSVPLLKAGQLSHSGLD